jgi:hypothetical protein
VAANMAFQESPVEVQRSAEKHRHLTLELIPGADHFYSGVREQAWRPIEAWLMKNQRP